MRLGLETLEDRLVLAPALLSYWTGVDMDIDASLNGGVAAIPPDPSGAIGTTHSVAIVNRSIEVQAKGGELIPVRASLNSFFGSGKAFMFDPKVLWDRHSQRFFVVALESDKASTSAIWLAVSPTGDPRNLGSWNKYRFDAVDNIFGSDCWADYPGFAADRDAIYITANMFAFGGGYKDSRLWIVNKANLINGTLTQTRYAPPNRGFTMQPAQTYSELPTGAGTFIVTWGGNQHSGGNQLDLIRVANPLGAPTFTTHTLDTGSINAGAPPDAPQAGSTALIDTGDNRIMNAVWHNGQLYAANTVTPPSGPDAGQATAHWYRIDTTNLNKPVLADQGNIGGEDLAAALRTYYPAVTVDGYGNMAVGFSASNATNTPVGAFYTTRRAGHPSGYTEPINFLRGGDDLYNVVDSLGRNRWGDYTGAGLDPDGRTFYFYNEYAATRTQRWPNGRWATSHGTTRYAAGFEFATAGGVTTFTTDHSIDSVRLERSATGTTIFADELNIATTSDQTIYVNAGWAGTTGLTVTNVAGGTYTLTSSQLVCSNLTVNFRNLAGFELSAGLGGGNVVVNVNGQPGILPDSGLNIKTGGGNDVVTIGNGTTPLPLAGLTFVTSSGGNDQLILNDQGTTAAQTWAIENPAANITRVLRNGQVLLVSDQDVMQFNAGSGNDAITVIGAGVNSATVSAGGGNDVINVSGTTAGRPLTVSGDDGNDTVNVASPGNNLDTLGALVTFHGLAGTDTLNINDTANTRGDTWTLTPTVVSRTGGPNPAIPYGTVEALNISLNAGSSIINVTGTAAGTVTTINGVKVNLAPTDIALSNTSVPENSATGTVVGNLSATDPDAGDSHTFSLTNSAGGRFKVVANQVQVDNGSLLNLEANTSHNITVRATDAGGLTFDKTFTISVTNVNEAPTEIALSNSSVPENSATGTVVGNLSAADPDAGDSHTFSLIDSAGGRFKIVGNQVQVDNGSLLNLEANTRHNITVRATDAGGLTFDKTLTINVIGPPAVIDAVSGGGQSAVVATSSYGEPLVVRVTDQAGQPLAGVGVTFTSPAALNGAFFGSFSVTFNATTDANGRASAIPMPGARAGSYTVTASVDGVPGLSTGFTLTNTPGAPHHLTSTGGGQSTPPGAVLGTRLSVRVLDSFNNPIPNIAVTFSAPASGPSGTFGGASSVTVSTDGSGVAAAPAFTANSLSGSYAVTASVVGTSLATPFAITNLATPTLRFTAAGGTYSGSPTPATATVAGLDGIFGASLEGVTPSLTYYAGIAPSGTPMPSAPVHAGTYTVVASFAGSPNYASASASVTFFITRAPLLVTANNASKVYGTPNPAFGVSYKRFVGGDGPSSLGGTLGFSTAATMTSDAGNYSVTPGGLTSDDYDISFAAGDLQITKADQTITWANPAAITYGAALGGAQLNAAVSVVGPAPAGALTYSPAAGTVLHAGKGQTLSVAAAGTNNYNPASASVMIDVNPAILTVTANNASRTYGAANPPFTAKIAGFVNGDGSGVVGGSPSLTTPATAASDVGTYPIVPSQGSLSAIDYVFAFADGALTVNRAALTVDVDDAAKVYGQDVSAGLAGTITGIQNNDPITAAYSSLGAGVAAAPGAYAIDAVLADAGSGKLARNYDVTILPATLAVAKDGTTIQVTSSASTVNYGQAVTFTATVTANAPGSGTPTGTVSFFDGTTLLGTGALSGGTTALTAVLAAGTHDITVHYIGDSNFLMSTSNQFTQTVLSAAQQTTLLVNQVNGLASSDVLNPSDAGSLTEKLNAAKVSLDTGKTNAGVNQLKAFINQVNAFVRSRRLTAAQGQLLIDAANQAIASALT